MQTELAAGLHVPAEGGVDSSAYDQWVGRWSRLFVPAVLAAGDLRPGLRVLDVSTGTGEASLAILPCIGSSGLLVGADIAPTMLQAARSRLTKGAFLPVAADGQALPFADASFDAVICQLGLQFFPDPGRGLMEFRRVLRDGCRVGICVISTPDRAPMWGILAEVLSRAVPARRDIAQLSFALAERDHGFRSIVITETLLLNASGRLSGDDEQSAVEMTSDRIGERIFATAIPLAEAHRRRGCCRSPQRIAVRWPPSVP